MSKMYEVSAIITRHSGDSSAVLGKWEASIQCPTFYLMADVQGIVGETHARHIAENMFVSLGHDLDDIHVSVCETSVSAHV